jgi:hypothetical protein
MRGEIARARGKPAEWCSGANLGDHGKRCRGRLRFHRQRERCALRAPLPMRPREQPFELMGEAG